MASLLLLASLGVQGCAKPDPDTVHASGQIEATEVRLATKVGGVVSTLAVEEGDSVAQGQVLATLDTVDLVISRGQAEAELAQSRAQLALLQAGSRAEDVAGARAALEARRSEARSAEEDFARAEALLAQGAIAEQARDIARSRRDVAVAGRKQAEETLRRLERGSRPEEIAAGRATVARAVARLDAVAQQIEDAVVRAPLDGTVSEKLVEPGELVTPGTALLVVTDSARPWLTAFVTGEDLPRVRVGATATVMTDAKGDRGRAGRVASISPTAEFTPRNVQTRDERVRLVYRVKIRVDNADGRFKPGMSADAAIAATPIAGQAAR